MPSECWKNPSPPNRVFLLCYCHDLRPLSALGLTDTRASFFGGSEAAIDEGFLKIKITFVVKGLCEDFEYAFQNAGADPLLKSPMARLIRWIAVG